MNVEKALRILGLQQPTSLEEVEETYQQLAKENHPDKGGDNEKMQELNVARDVIRATFNNQALATISVVTDLMKKTAEIAIKQEIREELNDLTKIIKKTPQNRLIIYRNLSIIFAAIAIALIFFAKDVLPKDFQYSVLFIAVGAILGFIAWLVNEKVRRYSEEIDELKQFLSQKKRYIDIFSQIFPEWKNSKWSFNELNDAVYDWVKGEPKSGIRLPLNVLGGNSKSQRDWKRIAKIVGSEDFANLLLLKAKELKILEEEIIDGYDAVIEYYSINLKQKSD